MKRAAFLDFGSLASYRHNLETYDPDKLGLGRLMLQKSGASPEDNWCGPMPVAVARPMEQSVSSAAIPWAMRWSESAASQLDWVFLAAVSSAAASRRIGAYLFNRLTGEFSYKGFINLLLPTLGNQTIRAFRMSYEKYTAGTVEVTSTTVTGTGTAWATDRIPVGCRIGFGSTDPTQISTWFHIAGIASDGSMTIDSAAEISAGTPYVIEDLRAIILCTNSTTATNGGLFIAKGLSWELFTDAGTNIFTSTTVDSQRATYWLKTAATEGFTGGNGMGLEDRVDWQTQYVWIGNGTTNHRLGKLNIRAALTGLASGQTTSAYVLQTAISSTLSGTASQNNNGRIATAQHGPGAGVKNFYFTTTTRIYRCKPLDSITDGDTGHIIGGDSWAPLSPGGAATMSTPSGLANIEFADSADVFVIGQTLSSQNRQYVSRYNVGSTLDRVFGSDHYNNQSGSMDSTMPFIPNYRNSGSFWLEDSLAYWCGSSTSADSNILYAFPLLADWEYDHLTQCNVITPRVTLPDCDRITAVLAQEAQCLGGRTGSNLGIQSEPFRISYRTSGISDNSGAWTALDDSGECNISGASEVQFRIEFRTIGPTGIPTRIFNLGVIYEDTNTDSRYQFSGNYSVAASKRFAWRHATAFGGSVPALRVRLYDAVTGSLLVEDTTSSPTGIWERSTDGTNWVAWTNTDKTNDTTYVRYTPASIADNVHVRAVLTLA